MSQKTAILAVIFALMGLGMMTSAFAKPFGKNDIQYTGDIYPIASTSTEGGDDEDSGEEEDDEEGVPVIIYIDIKQVGDDDASI